MWRAQCARWHALEQYVLALHLVRVRVRGRGRVRVRVRVRLLQLIAPASGELDA